MTRASELHRSRRHKDKRPAHRTNVVLCAPMAWDCCGHSYWAHNAKGCDDCRAIKKTCPGDKP